jgi:hypothetical protein
MEASFVSGRLHRRDPFRIETSGWLPRRTASEGGVIPPRASRW